MNKIRLNVISQDSVGLCLGHIQMLSVGRSHETVGLVQRRIEHDQLFAPRSQVIQAFHRLLALRVARPVVALEIGVGQIIAAILRNPYIIGAVQQLSAIVGYQYLGMAPSVASTSGWRALRTHRPPSVRPLRLSRPTH